MIAGIFDPSAGPTALRDALASAGGSSSPDDVWTDGAVALQSRPEASSVARGPIFNDDSTLAIVFSGEIYNGRELGSSLARCPADESAELLLELYRTDPQRFLDRVNGRFAFGLWDARRQTLLLGRDRLGIEPLYYSHQGSRVVFASSVRDLLATGAVPRLLNRSACLQYLLFDYNPSLETLVDGVSKLRPGHLLDVSANGAQLRQYWRLSFAETRDDSVERMCGDILDLIKDSVRLRFDEQNPSAVLLSGGTDSSALVSISSGLTDTSLATFSFRCAGKSYDESQWARLVSNKYGTRHTEIAYGPEQLRLIESAVEWMDEPFCDAGIELATFLLGQAARGAASSVMSGEGGDELFAGHPSYSADKAAGLIGFVPKALLRLGAAPLLRLPDTAEKKSLPVKLKRLAYGITLPPELLSNRWRAHYHPHELSDVVTESFAEGIQLDALFDSVLGYNREADGPDLVSRSLYGDYQTLVGFYLRRLGLLRAFDLKSRVPLLDHRLVEYAATVPSHLKLRGLSETKYIYRRALEPVLPRAILYDRPKLGHSVPLKNWLREDPATSGWVRDTLLSPTVEKRGIFRTAAIRKMIDEHAANTHNHAHRIWGMMVLELWLRSVWDSATTSPPVGGS